MKKEFDREEKLLEAIGGLPEDMVAQAAEYKGEDEAMQTAKRERKEQKPKKQGFRSWSYLERGLAIAACVALVLLGSVRGIPLIQKYAAGDKTTPIQEDIRQSAAQRAPVVHVWGFTEAEGKNTEDNKKGSETEEELTRILIWQKTVRLALQQEIGEDGTELPVLTFEFAKLEDMELPEGVEAAESLPEKEEYFLRSEFCNIAAVVSDGQTRIVNGKQAECRDGDTVKMDMREVSSPSLSYPPVAKWVKRNIDVRDIIHISLKDEDGEGIGRGRIVIGQKGENYYAVYQMNEEEEEGEGEEGQVSETESNVPIYGVGDREKLEEYLATLPEKYLSGKKVKKLGFLVGYGQQFYSEKQRANFKKIWLDFFETTKEHQKREKDIGCERAVVIVNYTIEGDPIYDYISYINGEYYLYVDSSRDRFGSGEPFDAVYEKMVSNTAKDDEIYYYLLKDSAMSEKQLKKHLRSEYGYDPEEIYEVYYLLSAGKEETVE